MTAHQPLHPPHWLAWRLLALAGLLSLLGLLVLAGCMSLPTIVPDLSRRGPAVQLQGARGPLSTEQSKATLDRLESRGQDTDIFARHLALEEAIVGSPLTTGNEVLLLQDGPATYQAMLAAILGARDHINMETYILDDDEVGERFAQALIDKQQQGVQVNAILHSKTALVDGVWATVGSTNLDWRSFLHNHELNAVVLGAEFGSQVQAMFKKDLDESDAITLEQWERRALHLRLQEWFARVWEYWL